MSAGKRSRGAFAVGSASGALCALCVMALLAVALLGVPGCADDEPPAPAAGGAPATTSPEAGQDAASLVSATPSRDGSSAPADPAAGLRPLPDAGDFVVEVEGGRATILANRADRLDVLRSLARQAGFELEIHPAPLRRLSTRIEDEPLSEALARVLRGVPFAADHEVGDSGQHVLAWVAVGEPAPAPASDSQPAVSARAGGGEPGSGAARSDTPRRVGPLQRLLAGRIPDYEPPDEDALYEEELEQEAVREQLESGDPVARAAALSELDIDGESVHDVVAISQRDPDPNVRLEAVKVLGGETSIAAMNGLRAALKDPSVPVVLEALGQLEFADDSVAVDIIPVLDHPDPTVRQRADEVLEDL